MKNIIISLFLFIIFVGCSEEINIPVLSDAAEIERYVADDDVGKIFFTQANLISDLPYKYPLDTNGYYVDLLDSIDRIVNSDFPLMKFGVGYADPVQDFGSPFGYSQDAEVEVHDRVFARTIWVKGVDTTLIVPFVVRDYYRYGYFMKLGNDGQKFSGWIMRGFSGNAPDRDTKLRMYHPDNQWFSGDTSLNQHYSSTILDISKSPAVKIVDFTTTNGYLLLNGDNLLYNLIERVSLGEQLRAEVVNTYLGVFHTMLYNNGDSTMLENFALNNTSKYEVEIPITSVNNKTWDFIYFQEFVRNASDTTSVPNFQTLKRRNWVVPIKIE